MNGKWRVPIYPWPAPKTHLPPCWHPMTQMYLSLWLFHGTELLGEQGWKQRQVRRRFLLSYQERMLTWMSLIKAERSFVYEMPTRWNIKNANREPRKEKWIPCLALISPSIFPGLFNCHPAVYLFNKVIAADQFYRTKLHKVEYMKLIINSLFHWVNICKAQLEPKSCSDNFRFHFGHRHEMLIFDSQLLQWKPCICLHTLRIPRRARTSEFWKKRPQWINASISGLLSVNHFTNQLYLSSSIFPSGQFS